MNKLTKQTAPFTQVPNELLQDRKLSMKSKGLYAIMFSKPEGWAFYESALVAESADGKDALHSALKELLDAGWLKREARRGDGGKFATYDYQVLVDRSGLSDTAIPRRENRDGKPATSNTDSSNTNEIVPSVSPQPTKASRRGSTPAIRLEEFLRNGATPFDGLAPSEWGSWANEQFGWDVNRISREWEEFSDYWTSGNAVHGGRKADWFATWRSHCRRSANRGGSRAAGNSLDRGLAGAMRHSLVARNGTAQPGGGVSGGQGPGDARVDGGGTVPAIPAGEIPF
ncbi:hypothetical protein [Bradyrhizobium manausense]|uniref:hypothetical protein n=1 Tax=Bradyrhizobium manausense TaxID=989370 RepID=UPI001BA4B7F1|nr:hypothetical protein [Bradyrhizobium manausense]MBR0721793.1 hypothetical protein [Bradyrhizobium manausense]